MAAKRPHEDAADRDDVLEQVREGCGDDSCVLAEVEPKWQADKEVVMTAVRLNGNELEFAHHALRADKAVVMTAVSKNGHALQYADKTLQADKEVVMTAVGQFGLSLHSAVKALKADKEVVMTAVGQSGMSLRFAVKALKADKEVVMAAVGQAGTALEYADKTLQADKEVVTAAVKQHWVGFTYADHKLQCDAAFVQTLMDVLPMHNIVVLQVALLSGRSCFHVSALSFVRPEEVLVRSAMLLGLDEETVFHRGELVVSSTGARLQDSRALRALGSGMHELQLIVRSERA